MTHRFPFTKLTHNTGVTGRSHLFTSPLKLSHVHTHTHTYTHTLTGSPSPSSLWAGISLY